MPEVGESGHDAVPKATPLLGGSQLPLTHRPPYLGLGRNAAISVLQPARREVLKPLEQVKRHPPGDPHGDKDTGVTPGVRLLSTTPPGGKNSHSGPPAFLLLHHPSQAGVPARQIGEVLGEARGGSAPRGGGRTPPGDAPPAPGTCSRAVVLRSPCSRRP